MDKEYYFSVRGISKKTELTFFDFDSAKASKQELAEHIITDRYNRMGYKVQQLKFEGAK